MFRPKKREVPPDNPFDVDPGRGTIKRKADGVRVMTLTSPGWATLQKELATTFVSGSAVILQRMGYSYGRYYGRMAKAEEDGHGDSVALLQNFARVTGLGELALNGGDLSAGEARLALRSCIFCLHIKEASEPVCHVLAGLIGGIADEVIGGTHRVLEEKCIGKGDAFCEVLVERTG